MRTLRHTLPLLAVLVLLCACSGRPRIIPRGVMTNIYADMFLADQWLEDNGAERSRADTMLFYDPIFKHYGYTFEDYDASIQHYLKDPEKFSKIFRDASLKLKDGKEAFHQQSERLRKIREFNESIKGYSSKDFRKDTLVWRSHYKDSLREAIRIHDSLMRDSLYLDSLRIDSLRRDSLRLDSLEKAKTQNVIGRRASRDIIDKFITKP